MLTYVKERNKPMKWKFLLSSLIILISSMLTMGFHDGHGTDWGESAPMGQGEVKTFVTLNEAGEPQRVGVHFTEGVLSGLPAEMSETVLNFPESIEATPLDHFVLNWNPHGHLPVDVYSVPHLDFHFYSITEQERTDIIAGTCTTEEDNRVPDPPGEVPVPCDIFAKGMQPLPAAMFPPDFSLEPLVAPAMGNHLLDFTAPEFNGEPFTHTWIYGVYEGQLTFFEPMITNDFLAEQEDICQQLKTPEVMPEAGWYPTEYCLQYLDQEGAYTVSLESFEWFEAASAS